MSAIEVTSIVSTSVLAIAATFTYFVQRARYLRETELVVQVERVSADALTRGSPTEKEIRIDVGFRSKSNSPAVITGTTFDLTVTEIELNADILQPCHQSQVSADRRRWIVDGDAAAHRPVWIPLPELTGDPVYGYRLTLEGFVNYETRREILNSLLEPRSNGVRHFGREFEIEFKLKRSSQEGQFTISFDDNTLQDRPGTSVFNPSTVSRSIMLRNIIIRVLRPLNGRLNRRSEESLVR